MLVSKSENGVARVKRSGSRLARTRNCDGGMGGLLSLNLSPWRGGVSTSIMFPSAYVQGSYLSFLYLMLSYERYSIPY
jgi:hypothetical protein